MCKIILEECSNPCNHTFVIEKGNKEPNLIPSISKSSKRDKRKVRKARWNSRLDHDEINRLYEEGLTQEELAKRFDTNQPYISRILSKYV